MYHSPLDRCAAHRSHTAAWLVDFPCGFAKAADNQSHSLICRLHLLTRKHCWGPWESCTEYLLQALGKKSPVYKSVDHSGQKIRVTPRPDSCVLEGGGMEQDPAHASHPSYLTALPGCCCPAGQEFCRYRPPRGLSSPLPTLFTLHPVPRTFPW